MIHGLRSARLECDDYETLGEGRKVEQVNYLEEVRYDRPVMLKSIVIASDFDHIHVLSGPNICISVNT